VNLSGAGRLAVAARVLVGGILLASGLLKAMVPAEEFALALENYQLLPVTVLLPLARVLPWVEIFVGAFLWAGFSLRASALAAVFLHAVFFAVTLSAVARGLDVPDCGCFGSRGPHMRPAQVMILDAVLVGLSWVIFRDPHRLLSLDRRMKV
jgi:uncharacterized membrane protein YphA (DoxX/SURF4 family)